MSGGKAVQDRANLAKVATPHPILLLAGDDLSYDIGDKRMPDNVSEMTGIIRHHGSERFRAGDFARTDEILDRRDKGNIDSIQQLARGQISISVMRLEVRHVLHAGLDLLRNDLRFLFRCIE